ncbi:MAG: Gfo/Idh/MocA family oxidoreductase [Planctomycetes bacterium]|nr:Gfo/Idh/MocA family oxidoreductase [Planctomycetota bacterium]
MTNGTRRGSGRREFLKIAGAAVIFPRFLEAGMSIRGANERISVAHIGVGGMGSTHLRNMIEFRRLGQVGIAAVCDVDAIIIATPDHWHPVQCVHGCESGKHVYVEKPASVTIEDGRAMVEAAHDACTYIRNGMLGRVTKVTCWRTPNPVGGTDPDSDPPPELDWDLWLGPLRWRPFNRAYCHSVFRWVMESGGGVIRDRGAHVMSIILWCLGADAQTPVAVEAKGAPPPRGMRTGSSADPSATPTTCEARRGSYGKISSTAIDRPGRISEVKDSPARASPAGRRAVPSSVRRSMARAPRSTIQYSRTPERA